MSQQILSHLRAATAETHQQLEAQIDIPRVCATRESYQRLVEDFFGFIEPFEQVLQNIAGWEERGFRWQERAKTEMLREDLQALGLTPQTIDALPRCPDLPAPATLAEAFGSAYVLEGSTLGGRQIVGILQRSDVPAAAWHYFSSYKEAVGTRWRDFCEMLGEFPDAESALISGRAVETFTKLANWLNRTR